MIRAWPTAGGVVRGAPVDDVGGRSTGTPDELGSAWDGRRVHLPLHSIYNGQPFGCPNAGVDMTFDFPTLIAHAATVFSQVEPGRVPAAEPAKQSRAPAAHMRVDHATSEPPTCEGVDAAR